MKHELSEFEGEILGDCPHCGELLTSETCEQECPKRTELPEESSDVKEKPFHVVQIKIKDIQEDLIHPADILQVSFQTEDLCKRAGHVTIHFTSKTPLPKEWFKIQRAREQSIPCVMMFGFVEQGEISQHLLTGYIDDYAISSFRPGQETERKHSLKFKISQIQFVPTPLTA